MNDLRRLLPVILCLSVNFAPLTLAQQATSTRPLEGLRTADASRLLLTGAEVVVEPGKMPRRLDVLIRGTTIVAVGESIESPPGTERLDFSGKRIYAGLIDALHEVELPSQPTIGGGGYWNENITPQYDAAWAAENTDASINKLRRQGFTAQLLAPKDGIIKGRSCVVLLVDAKHPQRLLKTDVFQHATLTVPRGKSRGSYPNSPMGATALLRQSIYDAIWYRDANHARQRHPNLARPEPNEALAMLSQVIQSGSIVIDAANERMAIRADDIADEFSLNAVIRGSGREYRALDEIAATGRTILLPVDFPAAPDTSTVSKIRQTTLTELLHWHYAPENPAKLAEAGIQFCLTSDSLDDPETFLKQIRIAVDRGLDRDIALSSITTVPAKLLGVDAEVGRVQSGMLANLVVTDGELFTKNTKILETWIAGERFETENSKNASDDPLVGTWSFSLPTDKKAADALFIVEQKGKNTAARITLADSKQESDDESVAELRKIVRSTQRFSGTVNLDVLDESFPSGASQIELLILPSEEGKPELAATITSPDGSRRSLKLRPASDTPPVKKPEDAEEKDKSQSDQHDDQVVEDSETIPLMVPLGAYGLTSSPAKHASVVFRNATVWTCGDDGRIEHCDVLLKDGIIEQIGIDLKVPKGTVVVDAAGKHLSPGIIDCHSHIATDGGVNESGQAITAEVRIGDFIDNSDIAIYRQLAGGVTSANVLHGSANPIGGQSQTLKFRWGASMSEMKFADAPAGIKFALGENVKRSTNRYPNTRMGVEQILRDQFLAARQYDADRKAWTSGGRDQLPPRRDLQMDALVEVQQGSRWVHCHSYRQDEIVATIDVLEEFNIRIGTLQHILEGYKVADRIAAHGAMASSFADWWAYKYEVFDAIPYNGILLHDAGIVVSFNSDDAEMGRHLNTEAAKATKYGNVPEEEALKFVTLNPAKQLRIDDRVGSIEIGKDADLVLWSGPPLSTTTRCEQTWIDGRQYFSLEEDRKLRQRDEAIRNRLLQLARNEKLTTSPKKDSDKVAEDERWSRIDVFCNTAQNRGDE